MRRALVLCLLLCGCAFGSATRYPDGRCEAQGVVVGNARIGCEPDGAEVKGGEGSVGLWGAVGALAGYISHAWGL